MKLVAWPLLACVLAYLAACSAISATKSRAYYSIKVGDSSAAVLEALGPPDFVQLSDKPFTRYASGPCAVCSERLWFENTLSLETEA